MQPRERLPQFRAIRLTTSERGVAAQLVMLPRPTPPSGYVLVRVAFSSLNYKDALALAGRGDVIREYPRTPGIDAAGTVVQSAAAGFDTGDNVICTNYDLGSGHDGGLAEYICVPAEWLVRLPHALSLHEAMALGTAGYTVGLALHAFDKLGLNASGGPLLVNGATGGVGSLAIDILSQHGFHIVASTRKREAQRYLRALGCQEVIEATVQTNEDSSRPLAHGRWAAAMDSVGGHHLVSILRATLPGAVVASIGNAGGVDMHMTVLPFILRAVTLVGINARQTPLDLRQAIWNRLAADWRPSHLDRIAHTVALDEAVGASQQLLAANVVGRLVVDCQRT